MRKLTVQKDEAEQRLDRFLLRYLDQAGGAFIYKMLRKKNITLNGRKAEGSERLSEGDEITLFLSDETVDKFRKRTEPAKTQTPRRPAGLSLNVIYEDEDVLFVNKPAGLLTQKAAEEDYSLNDLILQYLRQKPDRTERNTSFTPSVCNRLDRNTSGLVTAGKSLAGLRFLNEQFRGRTLEKYYLAVAAGRVEAAELSGYLLKDRSSNRVTVLKEPAEGADPIRTGIRPLAFSGGYSLVRLQLYTGKSHQLRAVMQSLGHPVLGDPKYGGTAQNTLPDAAGPLRFQLLHAWQLRFPALTGPCGRLSGKTFTAPPPAAFAKVLQALDLEFENG